MINLALVSRKFNGLAQPLVNRKIVFHFVQVKRHQNTKLIKRLRRETAFAREVRDIQILWVPGKTSSQGTNDGMQEVQSLKTVLPLMENLETFV